MKTQLAHWACTAITALAAAGCGSNPVSNASNSVPIAEIAMVPGDEVFHEWKEIVSVETREKDAVEKKVGYLDRMFTDDDPEGKSFVKDLKHDIRGFLLPGGKAFLFDPRSSDPTSSRDLGNTGFENGVKRILNVPGDLRFRPVTPPAPARS